MGAGSSFFNMSLLKFKEINLREQKSPLGKKGFMPVLVRRNYEHH